MASDPAPPKSILKKTRAPITPSTSTLPITPKSDAERKRLEVAVQHAHLIQEQKAIMRANLDAIEALSEYPASSSPTQTETDTFLSLLVSFQPSDYDALIEERHVNNLCGYTLCANPPRKVDIKRPWLKSKGSENWCSDDCAKRALYLKAQLDETPAWERRAGASTAFVLYNERKLPVRVKQENAHNDQSHTDQRDLAVERGEVSKVSDSKMDKVLKTEILENKSVGTALPPAQTSFADSSVHDLIEGYQPRSKQKGSSVAFKSEDSDDDDDE